MFDFLNTRLFRVYIIPGAVFQSVMVGGGYGTGREIVSRTAHAVLAVLAIIVSAVLSLWGITNLIAQGYGTMAWGFLFVYVVPLLSIGLYRIVKSNH